MLYIYRYTYIFICLDFYTFSQYLLVEFICHLIVQQLGVEHMHIVAEMCSQNLQMYFVICYVKSFHFVVHYLQYYRVSYFSI